MLVPSGNETDERTVIQRVAVAASCVILLVFLSDMIHSKVWTIGAMALLITLACAEKLASMMNTIAVEKDWVTLSRALEYMRRANAWDQVVTMAGNDSNYLRGLCTLLQSYCCDLGLMYVTQ
jgi:hypothetical protein